MFVCFFKVIAKDTNNISYTVRYGFGFPVIDYMSYFQCPGTPGQNMRPNRLSHTIIQKSSMNTMVYVNETIGFSENLFLSIISST